MAYLRLFWLGPPAIELDGHPLRLEMRKTLAFLAYLSLSPHHPTRETLASLFWPEYDQQHAMANLRRSLSSLGKSLPDGLLEADREVIGVRRVEWLKTDVDEFNQELSYANQHTHPADAICPECLAHLEKAVALYRGNFFEGFSLKDCPEFDEWQFFQREALQSKYAKAIETLAVYYASLGMWEEAISHTRSWVSVDPLNEAARRNLISFLAKSGQPWAARRQLEELLRILEDELDQKPEDETRELIRRLRAETQEPLAITPKHLLLEPSPAPIFEHLLKTKLYIPFSKGEKVVRAQVISKLNQIPEHTLTIISAPAGYGKTTALSEWIKQSPLPVGWLSLDHADNHQARFLTYLVATFQSIESEDETKILTWIQNSQTLPNQAIVINLVHQIEKIPYPFVLVLDDFQVIHSESIHEIMSLLLNCLPNNAHIVLSTRIDPLINLARLRTQGELLEIRIQDLRFTHEEIQDFFNKLLRLDISGDDIAVLEKRTEGWVAGLKMAALSLQRSTNKSKAIKVFSGSNRYILDYLLEEVLEHQPKYVVDFLLQTSILDQLSGPLCDTVTQIREWKIDNQQLVGPIQQPISSQQILGQLESENLFILSLDDERCWYRYHNLFAELLKARLGHFYPDLVESLHRHACEWYEQHGFIAIAVQHALASKSFEYAADVIERAIRTNFIWSTGDLALLLSWVNALPNEVLLVNPLLRIYLCAALYVSGEFKKSSQIVEDLTNSLSEILSSVPNPRFVEQLFLNLRILHEATQGDISKALDDSKKSQNLATGDEMADLLRRNYLLLTHLVAGDVENALHIARPSYEGLIKKGFSFQALSNVKNTADIYILQGRLNDTIELCKQVIDHCKVSGIRDPIAGILGFPIGTVLYERNELEMAENYLREGLDLLLKGPLRNDFGQGYALLAMIKQAQGDRAGALELVNHALQIAEYAEIPRVIHLVQAYRARIWLAQGKRDLTLNWAAFYQLTGPTEYPREIEDLTLAHIQIEHEQYADAFDLLEGLLLKARNAGRHGRVTEIHVLLSLAYFVQDRIEESMSFLHDSLRTAIREGYCRVYLDKGEPMQTLLRIYKSRRGEEIKDIQPSMYEIFAYVDKLLLAA